MEEYVKEALEIVKAQASVRTMTEDEITSMVRKLADGIRNISEGNTATDETIGGNEEARKVMREKSITCLECGKSFKVITKRHLAQHNLTPDEYRDKHGYKKGTPLVCKGLQRERRKKMKEMKLWERRRKN